MSNNSTGSVRAAGASVGSGSAVGSSVGSGAGVGSGADVAVGSGTDVAVGSGTAVAVGSSLPHALSVNNVANAKINIPIDTAPNADPRLLLPNTLIGYFHPLFLAHHQHGVARADFSHNRY